MEEYDAKVAALREALRAKGITSDTPQAKVFDSSPETHEGKQLFDLLFMDVSGRFQLVKGYLDGTVKVEDVPPISSAEHYLDHAPDLLEKINNGTAPQEVYDKLKKLNKRIENLNEAIASKDRNKVEEAYTLLLKECGKAPESDTTPMLP